MRRAEREITDKSEIEKFIAAERVLRVAFCDGGEIYVVPVNYGYLTEDGASVFVFHGAAAGRKYELAKKNPCVGFELDGKYGLVTGDSACKYSARYQSVIGTGKLSLVYDSGDKARYLKILMKQATGGDVFAFDESDVARVAVFKLTADKLTCKANL